MLLNGFLSPLFERFGARFSIPAMAHAVLEGGFHPKPRDAWFETVAQGQYTRQCCSRSCSSWMLQVVTRQQPSLHVANLPVPMPHWGKRNGLSSEPTL